MNMRGMEHMTGHPYHPHEVLLELGTVDCGKGVIDTKMDYQDIGPERLDVIAESLNAVK